MATRPKAVIESRNGEKFSPITIAKNILTDDGQNLHDILSDRKEDMMTPTIENSSSMFKVGQGNGVDYSENVVDGAYESCVLKGRSLVNILKTPMQTLSGGNSGWKGLNPRWSLKANTKYFALYFVDSNTLDGTIKDVFRYGDDQTIWGIDVVPIGGVGCFKRTFTLPHEVIGYNCYTDTSTTGSANVRCVLLEYQEGMENWDIPYFEGLCDVKSPILSNTGKNLFDNVFTVGGWWNGVADSNAKQFMRSVNLTPVKPNTTYAYDTTVKGLRQNANFMAHDINGNFIKFLGFGRTFTTPSNCHYIHFYTENDSTLYAQIEEGTVSTTIEPYKSNILSANGDKIELTEDMFEQGAIAQYINSQNIGKTYQWMKDNSDPNYDKRRLRLKNLVKVKPNTNLLLQNLDNFMYSMCGFDSNKLTLSTFDTSWIQNAKVTIPQNVHYISFFIRKKDDTAITINDFNDTNFTLSEVDKTIVLRSLPNGVCDTLNVETREYVQRIGETVLDGSDDENWGINNTEGTTTNRFISQSLQNSNVDQSTGVGQFLCDKLKTEVWNQTSRLGLTINGQDVFIYNASIDYSASAIKQWLSQNPITVQYELATPITKTVDLSGYPFAYKNGHVILSSGSIEQSLTPKVEYSVTTNRNGQIRSNQKMVERHQKQLDRLQAMILVNLVNTQYEQTLTNLKYDLKNVREEVK